MQVCRKKYAKSADANQTIMQLIIQVLVNNNVYAWRVHRPVHLAYQPTLLFSQNKSATSNQPAVLFSQNKSAPATSHQPNEQDPWCVYECVSWPTTFCWLTTNACRVSFMCRAITYNQPAFQYPRSSASMDDHIILDELSKPKLNPKLQHQCSMHPL
jgi:hypothetical protein